MSAVDFVERFDKTFIKPFAFSGYIRFGRRAVFPQFEKVVITVNLPALQKADFNRFLRTIERTAHTHIAGTRENRFFVLYADIAVRAVFRAQSAPVTFSVCLVKQRVHRAAYRLNTDKKRAEIIKEVAFYDGCDSRGKVIKHNIHKFFVLFENLFYKLAVKFEMDIVRHNEMVFAAKGRVFFFCFTQYLSARSVVKPQRFSAVFIDKIFLSAPEF